MYADYLATVAEWAIESTYVTLQADVFLEAALTILRTSVVKELFGRSTIGQGKIPRRYTTFTSGISYPQNLRTMEDLTDFVVEDYEERYISRLESIWNDFASSKSA